MIKALDGYTLHTKLVNFNYDNDYFRKAIFSVYTPVAGTGLLARGNLSHWLQNGTPESWILNLKKRMNCTICDVPIGKVHMVDNGYVCYYDEKPQCVGMNEVVPFEFNLLYVTVAFFQIILFLLNAGLIYQAIITHSTVSRVLKISMQLWVQILLCIVTSKSRSLFSR